LKEHALDIDVLDIAVAPGTGTPEPGGLTYAEVRDAVRAIARRGRVVGFDLVEVSPPYDWAEVTSRAAARLILDVLSAVLESPLRGRDARPFQVSRRSGPRRESHG
jgi:agmatinase